MSETLVFYVAIGAISLFFFWHRYYGIAVFLGFFLYMLPLIPHSLSENFSNPREAIFVASGLMFLFGAILDGLLAFFRKIMHDIRHDFAESKSREENLVEEAKGAGVTIQISQPDTSQLSLSKSLYFAIAITLLIPLPILPGDGGISFVPAILLVIASLSALPSVIILLQESIYVFLFTYLIRQFRERAFLGIAIVLGIINTAAFFIPSVQTIALLDKIGSSTVELYAEYKYFSLHNPSALVQFFPHLAQAFEGTVLSITIRPFLDALFWDMAIFSLFYLFFILMQKIPWRRTYNIFFLSLPLLLLMSFNILVGPVSSGVPSAFHYADNYLANATEIQACNVFYESYIGEVPSFYAMQEECKTKVGLNQGGMRYCEDTYGPKKGGNQWIAEVYEKCKNNFFKTKPVETNIDPAKIDYIKNFLSITNFQPANGKLITPDIGDKEPLSCTNAVLVTNRGTASLRNLRLRLYHPTGVQTIESDGSRTPEIETRDTGIFWLENELFKPGRQYPICTDFTSSYPGFEKISGIKVVDFEFIKQ